MRTERTRGRLLRVAAEAALPLALGGTALWASAVIGGWIHGWALLAMSAAVVLVFAAGGKITDMDGARDD